MNAASDKALSVADVMIEAPLTVRENDGLQDALTLMAENQVSGLPVVDRQGFCVGVITASDILRFAEGDRDLKASRYFDPDSNRWESVPVPTPALAELARVSVGELMTRDVLTVGLDTPLREAAAKMVARGVHRVLVIDRQERLRGILTSLDFVRLVAQLP
jgi:CBS domain-containing membrane protein